MGAPAGGLGGGVSKLGKAMGASLGVNILDPLGIFETPEAPKAPEIPDVPQTDPSAAQRAALQQAETQRRLRESRGRRRYFMFEGNGGGS